MQWANALNARSDVRSVLGRLKIPNKAFYIGLGASVIMQLLALFGPLKNALHTVPVNISQLAISVMFAMSMIIIVAELHKLYCRRTQDQSIV